MATQSNQTADGMVVIFEGVDGVGKTTQLELARDELSRTGKDVHTTRNLGGTPIGEELRKVAFSPHQRTAETDLYISAAIQAELAQSITAERSKGKIVLVDRGPLTLASYHIYGNQVAPDLGWQFADEGIRRFDPDLVILYKMDLDSALERAKRRKGHTDYYASKPLSYFKRVQRGYDEAARRYQGVIEIDASKSIDEVHALTMAAISKHKRH